MRFRRRSPFFSPGGFVLNSCRIQSMPMSPAHSLDRLAHEIDAKSHDPEARYAGPEPLLAETVKEIRFHAQVRYWQFAPTYGTDFEARLVRWLNNPGLDQTDQKALLQLVPQLQFIDRDDTLTLYRAAYSQQVGRWIMDQLNLDFTQPETALKRAIGRGMRRTWLCPVTDSMDIGQFCHVNGIATAPYRPQWRTLAHFGSAQKVRRFLQAKGLERIILLEDFVGSGQQVREVLVFAMERLVPEIPVLFVPLVISERGVSNLRPLCTRFPHLAIQPTFVIPRTVHVREEPEPNEPAFVHSVRPVILKTRGRFRPRPFGFHGIGTLVVSHANCPNNTPPLVWSDKGDWTALFPRVSRPGGWVRS